MRRICIILSVFLFSITAEAQELMYALSYKGKERVVHVDLTFMPRQAESQTFTYGNPMFGGQNDIGDCLQHLKVKGAANYTFDQIGRMLTIEGKGKDRPVKISYDIMGKLVDGHTFQAELFRPQISEDAFYCHGLNLFLTPSDGSLTQSVCWKREPDFPVLMMWNPDASMSDTISCHPMQAFMSLMVGSKTMDVAETQFQQVHGRVVTDLVDTEQFNKPVFTDFFRRCMSQLRTFWGDEDVAENYVYCVLPFSEGITHDFGGISLTGGFCSKYKRVEEGDTILILAMKFNNAHEMGHKWLGGILSLGTDQQWFHEGFNDYQTYINLLQAGLMSTEECQKSWQARLDSYYGSSVHSLPNDSILAHYWDMGDYNKLPYWRGSIFAAYLDRLIREASGGRQTWRDFMLHLRREALQRHSFTLEVFEEILQEYLPKTVSAHGLVCRHIIQGEEIERNQINSIPTDERQ